MNEDAIEQLMPIVIDILKDKNLLINMIIEMIKEEENK